MHWFWTCEYATVDAQDPKPWLWDAIGTHQTMVNCRLAKLPSRRRQRDNPHSARKIGCTASMKKQQFRKADRLLCMDGVLEEIYLVCRLLATAAVAHAFIQ